MNMSINHGGVLNLFKYAILVPFSFFIIYLLYLAGFSTSAMSSSEHTYLIEDNFWLNVLFVSVVISAFLFLYKKAGFIRTFIFRVNNDYVFYFRCRRIILYVCFFTLLFYVIAIQRQTYADSASVSAIAVQWLNGDYSSYMPGKYIDFYPHQQGIVTFLYFFYRVFGSYNYIAFQVCNIVCFLSTCNAFADMSDLSGSSNFKSLLIMASCLMFLPLAMYTTFVYGTIIGLCFAVNAVRYIYIYISAEKKCKWIYLAVSLCELFLAVAIKKNYLIFAIGYVIFCCFFYLRNKSVYNLIPFLAALMIVLFSKNVVFALAEEITGHRASSGNPTLSWVVMGLDENEYRYDGWWDYSVDELYEDADYDTAATRYIALERVQSRLKVFLADPAYAIKFFSGKNASQWNTPLFDAYYVNSGASAVPDSPLVRRLFSIRTMDIVMRILNPLQFAILAGAVFYMLLKKDKSDISLFYCVVFVGGFIFHTVWEAKGQYTIPYFVLLFPLAIEGYCEATHTIISFSRLSRAWRIKVLSYLTAFLLFGAVICWGDSALLNNIFVRNEDTLSYISYLDSEE